MEDDDETRKACFHFNPYGGKMGEISEFETPFPHRAGNIYVRLCFDLLTVFSYLFSCFVRNASMRRTI